jgi:DNA repair protein RadC
VRVLGVTPYKTIKSWPAEDRPREKLIRSGPGSLENTELLAILLRTGNASTQETALDQGRALLARFGSIRALGDAGMSELCQIKGIGPAKAAQVKAAIELAGRLGERKFEAGSRFRSGQDVFDHFRHALGDLKKESFHVVLLDRKNRKIKDVRISEGSLTSAPVHPREVFHPVVKESAAALILVHNHPSGDPDPSPEDLEITERLKKVGELLGVKILDHVIIGRDSFVSLAERGYL